MGLYFPRNVHMACPLARRHADLASRDHASTAPSRDRASHSSCSRAIPCQRPVCTRLAPFCFSFLIVISSALAPSATCRRDKRPVTPRHLTSPYSPSSPVCHRVSLRPPLPGHSFVAKGNPEASIEARYVDPLLNDLTPLTRLLQKHCSMRLPRVGCPTPVFSLWDCGPLLSTVSVRFRRA
ncbi:hypothetical protein FB45DRAFT_367875 [Roridomyces roridus]|uniref:Uncharacterized protein n=1 Tax=Roridomyces roridus TaxID=1738132 RepID=A0AAD7B4E2_9AGAR|nr:hypothetical protein FB45DRAFT_367875 [Roridomyces roridus]